MFLVIAAGFVALIAGTYTFTARQGEHLVEAAVLEDARMMTAALRAFRTVYTSEVVERVRPHGIVATHDYAQRSGAVPLPATLTITLGHMLGGDGVESRLYSPFPFPWRIEENRRFFAERFANDAWQALQDKSAGAFYRFETYRGNRVLRYATADRMRQACVDCHNSHPDSPRRDWKEGDVRGVLEVQLPMDAVTRHTQQALRRRALILGAMSMAFLAGLWFAVDRLWRRSRDLRTSLDELRGAQARLVQAGKLAGLGELAAGIAHELAQPLTGARGLAQGLERKLQGAEATMASKIVGQTDRMERLIDHLREFARIAPGKHEVVPISKPITDALFLIGEQLRLHGISLSIDIPDPPPAVHGDSQKLEQVLLNLFGNARDALDETNQEDKQITIRVRRIERGGKNQVEILFSDNGPGIPDSVRSEIWNPFFTTKPIGKGTGLGLSISHGIILEHGGTIAIAESRVGAGTTFRIVLPAADLEPAGPGQS